MRDVKALTFEDWVGTGRISVLSESSRDAGVALLLEGELSARQSSSHLALAARQARPPACTEDLDVRSPRGLDKSLILRRANGGWIRNHQVVLITGATGKSYLACALGHSACRHGLSTRYFRHSRLFRDLAIARGDSSYTRLLHRARTSLLVTDDYGLAPLKEGERRDLLEVLEDRYGRGATLVTSQLPFEHCDEAAADPTLADAILDRLVDQAHRISLKGPSMRAAKRNGRTTTREEISSRNQTPASLRSDWTLCVRIRWKGCSGITGRNGRNTNHRERVRPAGQYREFVRDMNGLLRST
jgi:DNA replication protein DnaC